MTRFGPATPRNLQTVKNACFSLFLESNCQWMITPFYLDDAGLGAPMISCFSGKFIIYLFSSSYKNLKQTSVDLEWWLEGFRSRLEFAKIAYFVLAFAWIKGWIPPSPWANLSAIFKLFLIRPFLRKSWTFWLLHTVQKQYSIRICRQFFF